MKRKVFAKEWQKQGTEEKKKMVNGDSKTSGERQTVTIPVPKKVNCQAFPKLKKSS